VLNYYGYISGDYAQVKDTGDMARIIERLNRELDKQNE